MQTTEYVIDPATGCWIWQKNVRLGYGRAWRDGRLVSAHRWFWEQRNGSIPEGLDLDHTCHNGSGCPGGHSCPHRRCVNPDHLEVVSRAINVRRGVIAKLSASQVAEIRAQWRASLTDLAEQYGVSYGAIRSVRSGQTWKEVEPADGCGGKRVPLGLPTCDRTEPLTEDELAEIKAAPRYHGIGRELAHRFRVSDAEISAIRTGRKAGMKAG